MNEFIEKAMLFINENTMLLIGICIFLILVLIGYLIDNSIKTRRLEKQELERQDDKLYKAVEETPTEPAPMPVEAAPAVEEAAIVVEKSPENLKAEIVTEEPVITEPVVSEPIVEEPVVAPVVETESMEDLLNKDFSKNAEIVNNLTDTQIIKPAPAPVVTEVPAEPVVAPVEPVVEPVITEPVVEEPKSIYKSNSKLSDILKKKEEKPKLETTQDFSDELDRILNKLNEESTEEEINNRF